MENDTEVSELRIPKWFWAIVGGIAAFCSAVTLCFVGWLSLTVISQGQDLCVIKAGVQTNQTKLDNLQIPPPEVSRRLEMLENQHEEISKTLHTVQLRLEQHISSSTMHADGP